MLLLAAGCAFVTARPPADSESAAWLAPGPHRVATKHVTLYDRDRGRKLASAVWWPADARGPTPLLVQAHGFLANRTGATYVARHLASRGYVVIAATHPTTTLFARGGPKVQDVVRQPGDVRFLIDRLLATDTGIARLPVIDPRRIAVMGHSLGGLTATLVAFHPRLRDSRIAAAIAIAGPMTMFRPDFFRTADVPFMMIAGTADVVVAYRRNALVTLEDVPGAILVSITGGSHAGFDHASARLPCLVGNPDVFSCWIIERTLRLDAAVAEVRPLMRNHEGVDLDHGIRKPCQERPPRRAMSPRRQQMLTTLAVTAFLESRFAPEPAAREHARTYLTITLPREIAEVRVGTATAPAADGRPRTPDVRR